MTQDTKLRRLEKTMNDENKYSLTSIFSCYVAIIPILQYYISPVSSVNLATFISFLFLFLFFLCVAINGWKFYVEKLILPLSLYVLFIFANVVITSSIFDYSYSWNNLGPLVRLIFLYVSLMALGNRYFDVNKAFLFLEKVLVLSAIFIFIHAVLYSFAHIRLNPIIQPLVTTDSLNLDLNSVRSGGFYMEPAHYAQSAILYICYRLFPAKYNRKVMDRNLLIIIGGVIFSGSGQGYVMLAAVYAVWVVYSLFMERASKKKITTVMASIVVVIIILVFLLQIPFVQNAVNRFIATDSGVNTLGGQALAGRSYTNHYFHEFNSLKKVTGIGFGHIASITRGGYTNSLYSHLIQCGYPSIVFLMYIIVYYFRRGIVATKVHVILYAIMITFSAMANPMMLCYFTQFYIGMCKQKREMIAEGELVND